MPENNDSLRASRIDDLRKILLSPQTLGSELKIWLNLKIKGGIEFILLINPFA